MENGIPNYKELGLLFFCLIVLRLSTPVLLCGLDWVHIFS